MPSVRVVTKSVYDAYPFWVRHLGGWGGPSWEDLHPDDLVRVLDHPADFDDRMFVLNPRASRMDPYGPGACAPDCMGCAGVHPFHKMYGKVMRNCD